MKKRLVSLLTLIIYAVGVMAFTIPASANDTHDLPVFSGTSYIDDNFSDGVLDSRLVVDSAGNHKVTEEDGKLHLNSTAVVNNNAYYYLASDKSGKSGTIMTEITLTRSKEATTYFQLRGTSGIVAIINWWDNNTNSLISLQYADTKDGSRKTHNVQKSAYNASSTLNIKLFWNTSTEEIDIWLNDIYAASGYSCGASNLSYLWVYTQEQIADNYVDDVKVYSAAYVKSDENCCKDDAELVTKESILKAPIGSDGYLIDSLSLPAKGINESTISWSSDNTDVISNSGELTRPLTDTTVTMTSTITKGTAQPIEKTFSYNVAGLYSQPDNMPSLTYLAYENKFTSNTIDTSHIAVTDGDGSVIQKDGVITATRQSANTANPTQINVYPVENKSYYDGNMFVEFLMTRKNQATVQAQLRGSSGICAIVSWQASNQTYISLQYADEKGGSRKSHLVSIADHKAAESLKVSTYFSPADGTVSFWLNNEFAGTGYSAGAPNLQRVWFLLESSDLNASVDDFRFYYAKETDEVSVQKDAELLNSYLKNGELTEGTLYKSVNLPEVGIYGSDIEWTTSNEKLVSQDGVVTRPNEEDYPEGDPSVNLTAVVSKGEVSKVITLTYKVLRKGIGDRQTVQLDYDALTLESLLEYEEKFGGYVSQNLNLPSVGKNGSTITWHSSDTSLVSANGTVNRPSSAQASSEVTLTAYLEFEGATLEKTFSFSVLPLESESLTKVLPPIFETIYEDDFSAGKAKSGHWTLRPWATGTAAVNKDNKMQLTRKTASEDMTYARLAAKTTGELVYDNIVVSFKLEKDGTGDGKVQLLFSSGGIISTINWQSNNKFGITYAESMGASAKTKVTSSAYTSEVTITALLNTRRKVFSLWINDELVIDEKSPARSITNYGLYGLRMDLEENNLLTMYMDNVHIYYAKPYAFDAVFYDASKITDESLLTSDYVMPNTIKDNLNLPDIGYYGSDITWESSDEALVSSDGIVNRPMDASENPKVTLTATIKNDGYITYKSINYYVLTEYSHNAGYVDADLEYLTFENYNMFSQNDASQLALYSSLNMPTRLANGSSVMWTSSDESAITTSGRVIRPHYDESPKTVILTASITYGDCTKTKDFECVVVPDEELTDPGYMSDEEFFGVWENGVWTTNGKFDYDANPAMSAVESAVKAGDYTQAKEAFLEYMKSRPKSDLYGDAASRSTKEVDLALFNGIWGYMSPYGIGNVRVTNHDWQTLEIPLETSMIANQKRTIVLQSAYNESSTISVASRRHSNTEFHPYIEVVADGKKHTIKAEADAVIRGGSYAKVNYSDQTEYLCKMFDEFTGDENYNPMFRFDLTFLAEESVIEDAKLYLTLKLNEEHVTQKDIILIQDADVTWEENVISWSTFTREWYSAEGIDGEMNWLAYPRYNESEYHQTHRFPLWPAAAAEFAYTKDERYAYEMIYTMMDYIIDSQFEMSLSELWNYNPGGYFWVEYMTYDEEQGDTEFKNTKRRGSLPHLLSSTFRLDRWISVFDILLESKYMTADACTTIMKNIWDVCHEGTEYLEAYALEESKTKADNFWTFEGVRISKTAIYMPEFAGCTDWIDLTIKIFDNMSKGGFYEDGSYQEASDGYAGSVIRNYYTLFLLLEKAGLSHMIPDDFTEFMYDATIYNELLVRDAYGIAMSWGDSGWSRKFGRVFENYEKINPDEEYLYLDTLGKEGTQPSWTSKHYTGNLTTFMRSDWSRNALHLFISSNGTGGHGHHDNNAIRLSAYGDYLLTDPGYMTYESSEYRTWGTSTRAHNTVEVDNYNQRTVGVGEPILGYPNEWSTNNQFDVLSQTSTAYNFEDLNVDVEHKRTITFLKSGLWIVSDLMLPSDDLTEHSYKQLWHMTPEYGNTMIIDQQKGTVESDVTDTNLIISSPDGNSIVRDDTGWYMTSWGAYESAPYTYYLIENAKGNTGFNTVLMPYPNPNQGALETEKIDLGEGVALDEATAMKITSTVDGKTSITSYMLEYEPTADTFRQFGDYSGDGMVNAIRTDENGKIVELVLNKGTALKKGDTVILETGSDVPANIGLEIRGKTAIVSTNDCTLEPDKLSFWVDTELDNVIYNNSYVEFRLENGMLYLTASETDEKLEDDSSADKGGVSAGTPSTPSTPGDNVGGGNAGGVGGGTVAPSVSQIFNDINGHWAYDSIIAMSNKNIVNGDGTGKFNPDSNVTRAEMITMAVRVLKLKTDNISSQFADVSADSWYAPYVSAALEAGLISPDIKFRPDNHVTREEMSKILMIMAQKYLNKDISAPGDFVIPFTDSSSISSWAFTFAKDAHYNGYINGVGNNIFAPSLSATRAQIATVLHRIVLSK